MADPLYTLDESRVVICPELYGLLRQTFPGGVIVANQGEGFQSSTSRGIDGRLKTSVLHSGEYYRVNCFACRDTRHRLWINHMYGQTDASGKAMRFLACCYNDDCLSHPANWKRLSDIILGFRNANQRRTPFALAQPDWSDSTSLRTAEPPGMVIPLSQLARSMPDHPAVQYMYQERRYTTATLDRYEVGYCTSAPKYPEAQGRIIFPIRMHGQLVGWQGRYVGRADWRVVAKYYGMPGMKKRLLVYNFDRARGKPFVVVVEGVTDCHPIGDHSVALLGKSLSAYQKEIILSEWANKPIVLLLDPDAREEMRGAVADLRASNAVVAEVMLPDGYDPGDYDAGTIWNTIYAQTRQVGIILPTA